jgi:hypothetical protein
LETPVPWAFQGYIALKTSWIGRFGQIDKFAVESNPVSLRR